MKKKAMSMLLTGTLLFAGAGAVACDKEDKKDVKEVGDNIDKTIDDADSDGKDD
jgi:hypothetical protein